MGIIMTDQASNILAVINKAEGNFERVKYKMDVAKAINKDGVEVEINNGLVSSKTKDKIQGYMIRFPKGHSQRLRVTSEELQPTLANIGIMLSDEELKLIDSGEHVAIPEKPLDKSKMVMVGTHSALIS